MPQTEPPILSSRAGTPRTDALAARVQAAADLAIAAFHQAEAERRLLHAAEWGQAEVDTLGDIELAADALHGLAAWALGGTPHPNPMAMQKTLESLGHQVALDLKSKLIRRVQVGGPLWEYVNQLGQLHSILFDYFAEQATNNAA